MGDLGLLANQVLDEAESTNDWARRLGEAGFPHGTWVSVRRQTAGRGRAGRRWESGEGNLFLSMVARTTPAELWTWVPLMTACAAASVIRGLYPRLEPRIKWPNDLWLKNSDGHAKMGGVLCEGSSFVVIGLGVNCAAHPEVDQPTTSLSRELGRQVTADDLRAEVIAELLHRLEELASCGPGWISTEFERRSTFEPGAEIEWGDGGARGTVLGLGPAGELRVVADGRELRLYAEDVRVRAVSSSARVSAGRRAFDGGAG